MDGKSRYQTYQRTKDYKQRYPHSSARYNGRVNNENPSDLHNHQSKSMAYSHFPAPISVEPLMTNKTLPSLTAIPQERQSWIHSMNKTKINGGTEQKTQYLETMLRMQTFIHSVDKRKTNESIEHRAQYLETIVRGPQQHQSSIDSLTFDRMRFADQQMPTLVNTMEKKKKNDLNENSFNLIRDIDKHGEISAIEHILLDHGRQSNMKSSSSQITNGKSTRLIHLDPIPFSGFLIDNCDEEEPSLVSPPSSAVEELIEQNQEDLMLIDEFDSTYAERKRASSKRQQSNKSSNAEPVQQPTINTDLVSIVNNKDQQELLSDWIIEYDTTETEQVSQLTSTIEDVAITMTDEDKLARINMIVKNIDKQQMELTKLREHAMSMLDQVSKSNTKQQRSSTDQALLKFLNQPIVSGCWLCSGKTYTEVATQSNNQNE